MAISSRGRSGLQLFQRILRSETAAPPQVFATQSEGSRNFWSQAKAADAKIKLKPCHDQSERAFSSSSTMQDQTLTSLRKPSLQAPVSIKEQEARLGNLIVQRMKWTFELDTIRDQLEEEFSLIVQNRLANPNALDEQVALMSCGHDQVLGLKPDKIYPSEKFMHLSFEEGRLLNMLAITHLEIQNMLKLIDKETIKHVIQKMLNPDQKKVDMASNRLVSCFEEMRDATHYYELLDYFENCDFIKFDSCTSEICNTITTEMKEKFPFLSSRTLYRAIYAHIANLRCQRFAELSYEFRLFLSSCKFMECNGRFHVADVDTIKQMDEFKKKFSGLSESLVSRALREYKLFLEKNGAKDEIERKAAYEKEVEKMLDLERRKFLEAKHAFRSPVFEMVYKTRKEGYRMNMNGDPHIEVLKMEKYFEEIKSANTANKD